MKRYIKTSESSPARPNWLVEVDIPEEESLKSKNQRIRRELEDEADAYDLEHNEGIYSSERANTSTVQAIIQIDVVDADTGEVYETYEDIWLAEFKEILHDLESRYEIVRIDRDRDLRTVFVQLN